MPHNGSVEAFDALLSRRVGSFGIDLLEGANMDNSGRFEETSDQRGDYQKLAHWLQQVVYTPQTKIKSTVMEGYDVQLELLLDSDYHLHFYQQLPDFILALLNNEPQATVHHAPLLYHLAGCSECHSGYLELYDALSAAIHPREPRPILGQGTRTLEATPQRMLAHLCQSLISQAEAMLLQGRRDSVGRDADVRALLQLALRLSSRIVQSNVRRQALRDLVRVATLFTGASAPDAGDRGVYAYTPTLAGAGSRGVLRGSEANTPVRENVQGQPVIYLQSHTLAGSIIQRGQTLELHLQGLDENVRNQHVNIAVPLGALIEPVRWLGGNPHAIRSTGPVDAAGILITPLGETELRLSNPEERNMLEAMFLLLEVRAVA